MGLGRPALLAVRAADRAPTGDLPRDTQLKNWEGVFIAFATHAPELLLADETAEPYAYITALANARSIAAAPRFVQWLDVPDEWVRGWVTKGLVGMRWTPAIEPLLRVLSERPESGEAATIVYSMFDWRDLRMAASADVLRIVSAQTKFPLAARCALELTGCIESGSEPEPRPNWWHNAY